MKHDKFIVLTNQQKVIMRMFYSCKPYKVVIDKKERNNLWVALKNRKNISDSKMKNIKRLCPAVYSEIEKSKIYAHNLQSAIFTECAYAQTFANLLNLNEFFDFSQNNTCLEEWIQELLASYFLRARYVYKRSDNKYILIQAGSCLGVDSALLSVVDKNVFTIEFKEVGAKTSEVDLPKYGESGYLVVDDQFKKKYPQFIAMIQEQTDKKLNFFDRAGSNVHDFSKKSIIQAVVNNYKNDKKYADVICTEDKDGFLTMLPANQVDKWARIEGEIRPAGRNYSQVWTPIFLKKCIKELKGMVDSNHIINLPVDQLKTAKQRGGILILFQGINLIRYFLLETMIVTIIILLYRLMKIL